MSACDILTLKARSDLNRQIRAFFHARGVLEAETPALSQFGNTDPHIESFTVRSAGGLRYLHTSPEYPMKRLLAAGSGDIYQICKVWREEESGSNHNPEFTLLEYYRVGFSFRRLMQEVQELLQLLLPDLSKPARIITYQQCFLETLGIDPHIASEDQLRLCAKTKGIDIEGDLSRQAWLDLLFTHVIEAGFDHKQLTFVYYYPAAQSALSCVVENNGIQVAQRFEVYCGHSELGNGYQELTDPALNTERLQQDAWERQQFGQENMPVDQRFVTALQRGIPFSAGIAIGLDRVLMCKTHKSELKQVISFAWELA